MQLVVRLSTPDDFEGWFELFAAVADEGQWIGREGPLDREERRRAFERTLNQPAGVTLLAELDGQLVGLLGVNLTSGRAELGMMVQSGHRGQGVGTALMAACLDWSRVRNAHKISLEVWPHNTRALALYRKFGFHEEGRLVRHYRRRNGELWDSIPMGLVLDASSPSCRLTTTSA